MKHKTQVGRYSIFTKYGRVGAVAAQNMAENFTLDKVVKDYNKTYKAKTSKAKGYTEIKISFEKKDEEAE